MSDLHIDKHFASGSVGRSALVKYHGLFNQGATCYLNSVLQVLFMTRQFREAVERYARKNSENQHIDHRLKALFYDLKQRCANTSKILRQLGIDKAHEERDAAEFFEKILSLTSPEASQIFRGELTHQTRCSKCAKKTNANGHFWHLPLELVDSNGKNLNVVDSIAQYFQTSHFNGENQMYCEECDSKSDATTNCQIKHHPEVLTLLLKRFDYDYSCMRRVKNDCAVKVPFTLQIPKSQMYELFAAVEHFGDLRSGHYTATIKSQDDERWYNFNDDSVKLLDHQPFQTDKTEKYRNAYLLFYRKKTTEMQDTRPKLTNKGLPSDTGRNANIKPKYDETGIEEKTVLVLVEHGHEVVKRKVDKTRHVSLERKKRSEGDGPGRRRTSSARYSYREEKHQNKPGLDSEKAGKWKNTQGSEIQTVAEDIKRGDVKHATDATTTAIKRRHSKKYYSYHDNHGEERSDHRQQNMSTNDPRGKQGGSKVSKNKTEEQREVKGQKERKREDYEPAQSKRRKMTNGNPEDEKEIVTKQLGEMNLNGEEMASWTRRARAMMKRVKGSLWPKRPIGCFNVFRKKRKNADKDG